MYQLGTKWTLWNLPAFLQDVVESITLRGYSTEPEEVSDRLRLSADLYAASLDDKGDFRGLSVETITSRYCPNGRDLYLEKKKTLRGSRGHTTWGRVAGHLIEEYCKGLLKHFEELAHKPEGLDYQRIHTLAQEYSQTFWDTGSHKKKLKELQDTACIPEETPERLKFLLQQTAKYELTMLGIDYTFSQNRNGKFVPLMQRIPVRFDEEAVRISPGTNLGLGKTTTPDFIILDEPTVVMGDIKTGIRFEQFHLHTIAGYALAYESQHKKDVNFGIVYFFETHTTQMGFARSHIFVIDDFLRRKFLDMRDEAYSILQRAEPPSLVDDYDKRCKHCKHHIDCYPDIND
jgi:CRISPR/Cas system-associated exonuclease Cas4 (RecB family)